MEIVIPEPFHGGHELGETSSDEDSDDDEDDV